MKKIYSFIYNFIIIPLVYIYLMIRSLFDQKVKKGISGRKRVFEELIINAVSLNKTKNLIWFHSSSLGEFEQAKPIIQEIKKNSNINILVTFFSPSGYENSKKYPHADLVSYLPFDTKLNAEKFMRIVRPNLGIFMRYDIWPNHIWSMKKFKVPSFIVDATMKKNSPRKLPIVKNFHKSLFQSITKILTVSNDDKEGFMEFGCDEKSVFAVGDTRFDRVNEKSQDAKKKKLINEEIFLNKKILVAGSTWEQDEEVILPAFSKLSKFDKDTILIIAPHEPTLIHLEKIEHEFSKELDTIRFSYLNYYNNERVIIVDSIGILLTLYTYADLAFVGGSFKQNIHNVLEAAVYGVPVLFGPKIENSQEANELLKRGGGVLIKNKREAYRQLRTLFKNEDLRKSKGKISYNYVHENLGATQKILKEIYRQLSTS